MLAVRFYQHGGPEVLKCEEVPTPRPGADEVLIRVEAAGVNYADTVRHNGDYGGQGHLDFSQTQKNLTGGNSSVSNRSSA